MYLLAIFNDFGGREITWQELDAWSRANRTVLSPSESSVIMRLDSAFAPFRTSEVLWLGHMLSRTR